MKLINKSIIAAAAVLLTAPTMPVRAGDFLICDAANDDPYATANPNHFPPGSLEKLKEKAARRRQSAQAACDKVTAEQAELQHKADLELAERERQRQVQAKLDAERAKKRAETEREQAVIDALPVNRLRFDYAAFAYVRFCHESRQGYLVQYVNDVEMEKAHKAIKEIVAQATKEDPTINTDEVWRKAVASLQGINLDQMGCHNTLTQLLKRSPIPAYSTEKP
jgi:hypothetical protein